MKGDFTRSVTDEEEEEERVLVMVESKQENWRLEKLTYGSLGVSMKPFLDGWPTRGGKPSR